MKNLMAELSLAVITAIIAIILLGLFTSEGFMANVVKKSVEGVMEQKDENYASEIDAKRAMRRVAPTIVVAQEHIYIDNGDYYDLMSNVTVTNADGYDLTSKTLCRIDGKAISKIFAAKAAGDYTIEYYVVDDINGVDYGKIARKYIILTVRDV